jgi:hypothetical protein
MVVEKSRRGRGRGRVATFCVVVAFWIPLRAQEVETVGTPLELESFVVSAARERFLDRLNPGQAVFEVSAESLRASQASSLGEALAALPGVGSASFGPAVGRPVIRGLSGERVRVLADGLATGDASAVSPDHAVALDPRLLRAVTVVRGPASLFYGNSALGGAVDVETRVLPERPGGAASGLGELSYHGVTDGVDAWLGGETPALGGRFAVHALWREHGDQAIPGLARRTDVPLGHSHGNSELTEEPNPRGRLPDSGQRGETLTLGWKGGRGPLEGGAGVVVHALRYDVPFHSHSDETGSEVREVAGVSLDLRQHRIFGEGQRTLLRGPLDSLHLRAAHTAYAHDELEGGLVQSSFAIRSQEVVLEGFREAREGGAWEFALGLYGGHETFSSRTRNNPSGAVFPGTESWDGALYGVARGVHGRWTTTLAGRLEGHRLALRDFDGFSRNYTTPTFALGGISRSVAVGASRRPTLPRSVPPARVNSLPTAGISPPASSSAARSSSSPAPTSPPSGEGRAKPGSPGTADWGPCASTPLSSISTGSIFCGARPSPTTPRVCRSSIMFSDRPAFRAANWKLSSRDAPSDSTAGARVSGSTSCGAALNGSRMGPACPCLA